MEKKAYLVLENGTVFEGKRFGASGDVSGELVFTTAMTGYLEALTDPSFYGQLVVQTFPQIGNYGVIPSDFESGAPVLKAYIVRDWCQEPSNFRCEGVLDTFLKEQGVVGLYDIDTRALTRIVREYGVMNARISDTPDTAPEALARLHALEMTGAVRAVTCKEERVIRPEGDVKHRVVLWDFGAKENIVRELTARGCEVTVVPSTATAEHILSLNPDGILLSSGPGDPADNMDIVEQLRELNRAKLPTFGICLGHMLMALAHGAQSEKLKYGHRGENQPAMHKATGRVYITSQNHGYAVVGETLPPEAEVSYVNVNDGTCEGVDYHDMPAFTVQFHPEAAGGPLDTEFLFDRFISLMEGESNNAAQ